MARTILYYQNRINILANRGKDNANIVKKLMRKIKILQKIS